MEDIVLTHITAS